jgi:hypothetical protein
VQIHGSVRLVSIITKFENDSDKAFPRLEFPKEKLYTIWSIKKEQLACQQTRNKNVGSHNKTNECTN